MTNQRFFLILIILGAFAWRVNGLTNQSLWRDEVDAIYFALRDLPDTLAMFGAMAQNGVLYFLSLRLWFHLAGATEFALRYISVLAGVVTVPLTWQVARRLLNGDGTKRIAPQPPHPTPPLIREGTVPRLTRGGGALMPLMAALLLAVNPYQLWYGQEGKMYTLMTALILLAHWCWLTGISRGGWRVWLLYLVTVSLALYVHLLSIIIIPLHLIWFLIAWPQSRRQWRGYGFALAGLTLPYLPFVWWQWAMLTSADKLTGFSFTPLPEMLYGLLMSHSYGLLPPPPIFRLLPIFFLGAVGLLLGVGTLADSLKLTTADLSPWRRYLLLVSWLFVPIATIYALSLRQPVYTDRYIIWIAPAAMILLALGAQTLYQNAGRLAFPLIAILLLYTVGLWAQMGWRQKTETIKYDLRSAITYVAERRSPDTLLILQIPHLEFSYRYYTSDFLPGLFARSDEQLGWWASGLWTNGGLADAQAQAVADQEMGTMTTGIGEFWVLSSEVEMWDSRHLMDNWLNEHAQLVESAEFHGVHARHYQLLPEGQP
jgi:4-amino-4-deoxy-L-arabinose transferase-like glycosyltransferase